MKGNNIKEQPGLGLPGVHPFIQVTETEAKQMQQELQEYQQSNLCNDLQEYFAPKPYYIRKKTQYQIALLLGYLGHLFSVLIGLYLAFKIGSFLFSSFSSPLFHISGQPITIGATLGAVIGLSGLLLWEILKRVKFSQHFKNSLQFRAQYKKKKQLWKLGLLLLISMVFNGYGGFEAVNIAFGEPETASAPAVDIDAKVAHIREAIAGKRQRVADWERAQQKRDSAGLERVYKVEKSIIAAENEISQQDSILQSKIDYWEQHNLNAGGKTEKDNTIIKAAHNSEKYYYAILCAIIALVFDILVISCLFYVVAYKYNTHQEFVAIEKTKQTTPPPGQTTTTDQPQQKIDNNTGNTDETGDADKELKFEIVTGDGLPYVVYNEIPLTLRGAKQRLSVARSRIKAGKDKNGTNAKNEKIFAQIIAQLGNVTK